MIEHQTKWRGARWRGARRAPVTRWPAMGERMRRFLHGDHVHGDRGAATAEYAITIMAAVGFAGLLVVIMKSGEVREILTDLVRSALHYG